MPVYLSAGAIIDRDTLRREAEKYPTVPIFVHPNAAIVTDEDKAAELEGTIAEVAGTRSGTGAALSRKILRDPLAIASKSLGNIAPNVVIQNHRLKPEQHSYFMEVAQGFSLGIHSQFYPKVTSRECTIMQGMADARIAPRHFARCYMAIRTFPIRVGNVDDYSSGEWYEDQEELEWSDIGVQPELTTVTKRIRRVATFSMTQFYEACYANDPDFVFLSHMDYLSPEDQSDLLEALLNVRNRTNKGFSFILGRGPRVNDIAMHIDGGEYE
jgi:adenylosuccinate synthase